MELHETTLSSPSNRLAPFNPISSKAQELALNLLNLNETDILFDLGCGDARLLISAAESFRTKCFGIECDPIFISRAKKVIEEKNLYDLVDLWLGDVMELFQYKDSMGHTTSKSKKKSLTLTDATAVFVYLLPDGLKAVKPILERIIREKREKVTEEENQKKVRFRVVSYMFSIPGWVPTKIEKTIRTECSVYLYDFATNDPLVGAG